MKAIRCALIIAVPMLLISCRVSSLNPLDQPSASAVDPAPYLGNWSLYRVGGQASGEAVTVTVGQVGTNMTVAYSNGAEVETETLILTRVADRVVGCSRDAQGRWSIGEISLQEGSNTLCIGAMDTQVVAADIQTGQLIGEVHDLGGGSKLVEISDLSYGLRMYIGSKTNLFLPDAIILKR